MEFHLQQKELLIILENQILYGLPQGLYILDAGQIISENYVYGTKEKCIFYTCSKENSTKLQYSQDIKIKLVYGKTLKDENINGKVIVIWDDNGYESKRPAQIHVALLRNGEIYDTIYLDENSDWKYNLEGLTLEDEWTIDKITNESNYECNISFYESTFIITMTYLEPDIPPPDEPELPDVPPSN